MEIFRIDLVDFFVEFRDFLMSALVIFVESSAFDIAFGDVFNGELGWGFLPEDVHSFCDMETDVAAKIGSYHFGAGVFIEARDGVADDAGVKVADVKDLEGIGVAEFTNDCLTG